MRGFLHPFVPKRPFDFDAEAIKRSRSDSE